MRTEVGDNPVMCAIHSVRRWGESAIHRFLARISSERGALTTSVTIAGRVPRRPDTGPDDPLVVLPGRLPLLGYRTKSSSLYATLVVMAEFLARVDCSKPTNPDAAQGALRRRRTWNSVWAQSPHPLPTSNPTTPRVFLLNSTPTRNTSPLPPRYFAA